MSRTAVFTALVLRCRSSGESNSEVTLLTEEEGIIKATLFGGPKSKLRAHCASFNTGRVWIYRDKSKDYAKLSDFDVHSWRAGLRELYERSMTAASVAETILSSHGGGGGWQTAFNLAVKILDTLEKADEELCALLHIQFLWQWAGFSGIQPNLENCPECGKDIHEEIMLFSAKDGTAACTNCASDSRFYNPHPALINSDSSLLQLNPGCRKWLSAVSGLEPSQLHRYSMDKKSFNQAKSLVTAILAGALGKRLAGWDWK